MSEGRSCDLAISKIVETIKNRIPNEHLALVSLDIKSAFDNMNWPDRQVFYVNEIFETSRQCYRGCPQGSVIAPIIWNFYINTVLKLNDGELYVQAFADDLALIIGGRTARVLEANTNLALASIARSLDSLKLDLSVQKCQAVVYRSIASQKLSKRNSTVLNRKPTFKIYNTSIRVTDSLTILGIIIDNKLTWSEHINSLYDRMLILTSNFNRILKTEWSVNKDLIKTWYLTTIEKALLYGASVWGGALTKNQITRLHSIQRIFLLKLSRGYRTTSTNVLNVLTGLPPLHITAEAEYIKFQIWVRRSVQYNNIIDNVQLDSNILIKNIPSEIKYIAPPPLVPDAVYEVYTDGSRMEEETGFAVCILQNSQNIQNHLFKLKSFNSVFQAELTAIQYAANWAVSNNHKINIYTDSLSSIMALKSAGSKSKIVNSVKKDLHLANGLVGLSWVKAHVGIEGNELSDQCAKQAITSGEELDIPAPRGHGPFPYYLHRFKRIGSPLCVCGQVGDADHYTFDCSLTKEFHLLKPADEHKASWFRNLTTNSQAIGKMTQAFRISNELCDSLTRDGDN
ncbi:Putative protein in type-1 retrotransposable element R1DM [Araneus ventricosus]|uniref:Retrovirus-related Pol polyprotein from type-1 retrotransposable element R1 n=1 Tax=Araneus ventricosus TaxID=182803 RepID=A0A4Y2NQN2_ARAVE|nr:Putative protein in type-1 retrotransposable element R1DM [Araneus ventricosus]